MKRSAVRYALSLIIISVLACGITACGAKTADESQIKQELESNQQFHFLQDGETIDEIVIEKRQTDKEQKTDKVWCSISTNDTEAAYQKSVVLTYGLYDKEGWILDDVDVDAAKQWVMTPLKGINESDAIDSLYGHAVIIDNEEWTISKDSLTKTVIESQETDLDGKTDMVTLRLTIDEKVERAEGKIEVSYFFDQGWKFDSILSNDAFEVSMKEEYALNVTEDDLIQDMLEKEITIENQGDIGTGAIKTQTVGIQAQEVSDFKIEEQSSELKGSRQIYQCSYRLNKTYVVLDVKAIITYMYQDGDGWRASVIDMTAKVESADIAGDWIGNYKDVPWSGKAELHISEVKEDGTVTAVYKYTSENTKGSSGSYELSGKWNPESLELYLEAGEWIEEPNGSERQKSREKQNVYGVWNIESGKLECHIHDNNNAKLQKSGTEED